MSKSKCQAQGQAKAREYYNTLKNLGHSKGGSGGEGKDNNNNNDNNVTPNKMKSYWVMKVVRIN